MLRIWTGHGFDLFFLWRWILAVSGGVYTVLRTIQSLNSWLERLEGRDRLSRIRRHYLLVHLLRVRVRDFWWELLQIVLWVVLLVLIIRGHYLL